MKTLDEFVMIIDGVVNDKIINGLFDEYASSDEWKSYAPEKGGGEKTATAIMIEHPIVIGESITRQKLADAVKGSLGQAFDRYHEKFSRRQQGLNFLHITKLVGLRLIRYETGQMMANHTDKYPDSDSDQVSWPAVTFTINLNEDFSGGELNLLDGDMVFKVKAGQAIFYPANFLYPHAVNTVTQGTRYALVGWFL